MARVLLIASIAGAAAVLVWGGARGDPLAPLGALWSAVHPGSLVLAQAAVERYVSEGLWSAIFVVLQAPAALLLLGLAGILAVFAFKK